MIAAPKGSENPRAKSLIVKPDQHYSKGQLKPFVVKLTGLR